MATSQARSPRSDIETAAAKYWLVERVRPGSLTASVIPGTSRERWQSRAGLCVQTRLPILRSSRRALAIAAVQRLVNVIERIRLRWKAPTQEFAGQVQRFGNQAWRRVIARWPALELLVQDRPLGERSPVRRPVSSGDTPDDHTPAGGSEEPERAQTKRELLENLEYAESWQDRVRTLTALAEHRGEDVMAALLPAVRDTSAEIAVAAIDALTAQPDARAGRALRDVLANAEGFFSPVARVAALSGLAERLPKNGFEPIFEAVKAVDAEVSIAAIALIAKHHPGVALERLLPLLRDDSGFFLPVVRLAAINALEHTRALTPAEAGALLDGEHDPAVHTVLARIAEARESA
jgi:hypothetical protein